MNKLLIGMAIGTGIFAYIVYRKLQKELDYDIDFDLELPPIVEYEFSLN